ncbi:MAG: hypothetical protein PHC61_07590 [Chitinivibrionales bacterium]|nr:hypothetical protein [Chitinivibrionales bacterium]
MIAKRFASSPSIANYKDCFKFYRDTMGFSVINGDENSATGLLKQGSAKIALYQLGNSHCRMVFSNIKKRN